MGFTFLRALLATTALVAVPSYANADSINDQVPAESLAAYCQEQGVGSETQATLTLADGTSVTGSIECEAEDLSVSALDDDEAGEVEDEEDEEDDEGEEDEGDDDDDAGEGEDEDSDEGEDGDDDGEEG